MRRIISLCLVLIVSLGLLAGCGETAPHDNTDPTAAIGGSSNPAPGESNDTNPAETIPSKNEEDMFTDRDQEAQPETDNAVTIQLNGSTATASSDSVTINGSTVVLREEATYVISGNLNGMLVVNAPKTDKLQLVFNGVEITSETSAALYILQADKVFVTLAEGTVNSLSNGGSFVAIDENNIDAALFSKEDLTLNGTGSLTVTSPAGHGIVCKDDLVITGGCYDICAAAHGLDANDSVRIENAELTFDAGKDAIHCENDEDTEKGYVYFLSGTIRGEAEGDGISASSTLEIAGGTIDLLVGGGSENGTKEQSDGFGGFGGKGGRPGGGSGDTTSEDADTEDSTSMKGLKAGLSLLISGGNITLNSADDAIHSNASVRIEGGTMTLASGDDAIHAEENLTITAGKIDISESYEGLEALHIDIQGGDIRLVASDDGLNAAGGVDQSGTEGGRDGMFGGGRPGGMSSNSNGSILISGGTLYINASGDGIDANGTLEITGGHTTVVGPTRGDTATLDYDRSAVISGGTFIGTGASGMAQTFSDSTQGVIALQVGNRSAGTEISLADSSGNTLITCAPELDFAIVILSTPEMVKGELYTVTVGSDSGEFEAS